MATEQDWAAYADQAGIATTDSLLVRTIAGAGVEVSGGDIFARRVAGGPFAAITPGATFGLYVDATSGANGVLLDVSFASGGYGPMRFGAGGGEAARITPSREFLVGTTTANPIGANVTGVAILASGGGQFSTAGGVDPLKVHRKGSAGPLVSFFYNGPTAVGSITTTGTATAYNTSSDYRLKEDLQAVENPLARLMAVPVWNFAWKATGARTDGFMAHELAEVVPCAVTGDKDAMQEVDVEIEPERPSDILGPDGAPVIIPAVTEKRMVPAYQGIDQAKLVPLLIAAVQELAGIVDGLTARVAELEAVR